MQLFDHGITIAATTFFNEDYISPFRVEVMPPFDRNPRPTGIPLKGISLIHSLQLRGDEIVARRFPCTRCRLGILCEECQSAPGISRRRDVLETPANEEEEEEEDGNDDENISDTDSEQDENSGDESQSEDEGEDDGGEMEEDEDDGDEERDAGRVVWAAFRSENCNICSLFSSCSI